MIVRPYSMENRAELIAGMVLAELDSARRKFPPFNSPHEGKAIIEEELDELWKLVKANDGASVRAKSEAIQVAAMAIRYVLDLC